MHYSRYWSLRDELYRLTHQWPVVLLAILAGCLLGWLSQFIWPTYYRATAEIYVALNPYRAFSDTAFLTLARPKYSNIDDFKNWQMSQLETVIFTEPFINGTMQNLRQSSSAWSDVTSDDLRAMLKADWRSAGTWSLVANHPDPARASQAAQAWSQVSLAHLEKAILAAQTTFQIDQELDAVTQARVQASIRRTLLQNTLANLLAWQRSASALPQDQPLQPAERWRVLALITPTADFTPNWLDLLAVQPDPAALPAAYQAWFDQAAPLLNAEISQLGQQIHLLENQQTDLAIQYTAASKNSLGLSPNLEIQNIRLVPPRPIRPVGLLISLGGMLGFLFLILLNIARISLAPGVPVDSNL